MLKGCGRAVKKPWKDWGLNYIVVHMRRFGARRQGKKTALLNSFSEPEQQVYALAFTSIFDRLTTCFSPLATCPNTATTN
jgi:hypothetical protein